MESTKILGCKVSLITMAELNSYIISKVKHNLKEAILNVNINCINLAQKHTWLKQVLNQTDIVFCDGDGVRLGASILGVNLPEKITYNRWIWDLAQISVDNNMSWYLFGSSENVIARSKEVLSKKFNDLNIIGFRSGYFNETLDNKDIIKEINTLKPNILILGMGMPKQEKWLFENIDKLDVNIILTGGAVFDYVSGNTKMTPNFYYKYKIEWLYRFIQEPRRLFKRYIIGNPLFILRVLLSKYKLIKYNVVL